MNKIYTRLTITFILALILTIIPLPSIVVQLRPPWLLLVALYIQFYLPQYFRLSLLFILGLFLDSLLSTVIGEHVFSLCFVAWLASGKVRRFSFFPMSQQMLFIGFFAGTYQLMIVLIDSFLGNQGNMLSVLGVSLMSVLFWPWLRLLGEEFLFRGCAQKMYL